MHIILSIKFSFLLEHR